MRESEEGHMRIAADEESGGEQLGERGGHEAERIGAYWQLQAVQGQLPGPPQL
jgi:hypothetical protein